MLSVIILYYKITDGYVALESLSLDLIPSHIAYEMGKSLDGDNVLGMKPKYSSILFIDHTVLNRGYVVNLIQTHRSQRNINSSILVIEYIALNKGYIANLIQTHIWVINI